MPVWLFMLYIAISIVGAVFAIVIIVFFIKNNRRLKQIYQEKKQDNAIIQDKCIIRNGFLHCPGVVQVIGDDLILYRSLGKNFRIPLAEVQVK